MSATSEDRAETLIKSASVWFLKWKAKQLSGPGPIEGLIGAAGEVLQQIIENPEKGVDFTRVAITGAGETVVGCCHTNPGFKSLMFSVIAKGLTQGILNSYDRKKKAKKFSLIKTGSAAIIAGGLEYLLHFPATLKGEWFKECSSARCRPSHPYERGGKTRL